MKSCLCLQMDCEANRKPGKAGSMSAEKSPELLIVGRKEMCQVTEWREAHIFESEALKQPIDLRRSERAGLVSFHGGCKANHSLGSLPT